jgi:hypothetical protein
MKKIIFTAIVLFLVNQLTAQPTSGLVAYWKLDGNINDAGPFSINGSNFGAATTANNSGALNSAMNFSNPNSNVQIVTQYATHPVNANLNFGSFQDFTIDCYVYFNNPVLHACGIYDNGLNYGGPGLWFWNVNGYPQVQFNFKNGSVGTTNGAITLGVWQHLTAVRNGTAINIYINGVLNVTGTAGSTAPVYSFVGRIGSMYFSGYSPPEYNGLNGKIDELRIYNRVLNQTEINQLQALLPVSLIGFSAQYNNNQTQLQWQTAQEFNSKNFVVQRSADGINFDDITTIAAAGNSGILRNYQYTDFATASLPEKIYYRLQQNDRDGRMGYSNTIIVRKGKAKPEITVYPNPVNDQLHLQAYFAARGEAKLTLYTTDGRIVLQKNIPVQEGVNAIEISVANLPKGNYILTFNKGEENYLQKILKE